MLKNILQMILLAVCLLSPCYAKGETLTAEEARAVAADFFRKGNNARLADAGSLSLAHVENFGGSPGYYVFNAADSQGFIIISAGNPAGRVVGYSTSSTWQPKAVPGIVSSILENVSLTNMPVLRQTRSAEARTGRKILPTPPWSQEAPFNNMIPNRRLVGCVGTALAEILRYHSHPAVRPAVLTKEGEPSAYDWQNMREDNYRAGYSATEADAVATLMADAANAISTDFGMSSSSAFEVRVPAALVDMFGYDAGVSYKKSSEMDLKAWTDLVLNEIDEGRPVLYCGQDVSEGHAFVCDGYEIIGPTAYFHINWGWGGAADGFYAPEALNPTVSKPHDFSNLTTIVYNIKPASSISKFSPIHITSDERQIGMTIDATDIKPGSRFKLRVGALKNISNGDFSGNVSVALFGSDGLMKRVIGDGKKISIPSLQIIRYLDMELTVPSDATVADGDLLRLVSKDARSSEWLPVANDLLTLGEASAKGYSIPYFNISIPASVDGAEISYDEPRVIKGRDFSFTVVPASPDMVVTVKANGFILTPGHDNAFKINNVICDQNISVTVQNAADVVAKRNVWVKAGKLSELISEVDAGTITDLTLYGTIDASDFAFMRDRMKLTRLDISEASILSSGANPANAIPAKAFSGCKSLTHIVLPKNLNTFKSGCFSYSGLERVEIPASVATYEYNVFLGCERLREVVVRRASPAWVNWCVFNGSPKSRLVVPVGSAQAYQAKEYWKDFREVVEENPVAPTHYSVILQEMPGVRFNAVTESAQVEAGAEYEFTVETTDSYGDATMQLYANNTLLLPDASGVYKARINANTLIHADFRQPQPAGANSPWKITGEVGGVGLVTDVVNVVKGKSFKFRANALAIPSDNAASFYCAALTDKDGNIKELISPIITNDTYNFGNLPSTFTCQVKDADVREGNLIRVVTSFDRKKWSLVNAADSTVADRLDAIGNRVVYHSVTMPAKVEGVSIQGGASQVVRGMPFSLKVTPALTSDRVTVAVNGINKVVDAAIANLSIAAVTEDLDITIQVNPAGANAYTVVNVREGELASKLEQCPSRLKITGVMRSEDFEAIRRNASKIVDLDLADVVVKGVRDLNNAIPSNAFAAPEPTTKTALAKVILPSSLVNIAENAFNRCVDLKEITLPASVEYVGANAFSTCVNLKKIIVLATKPPYIGSMSPFPANASGITLEIPKGAEEFYAAANFWNTLKSSAAPVRFNIQIDPSMMFNYNDYFKLTSIEYPATELSINIGLCSFKPTTYKKNPLYRPGSVFKMYDNGKDVTYRSYCRPSLGYYLVKFDPTATDSTLVRFPSDHILRLVLHYRINFNRPAGVNAEFVGVAEEDIWRDVDMSWFVEGSSETPTLYREGRDYKFRLDVASPNTSLKVVAVSNILVSTGENPVFEKREQQLFPDEEGIYTLADLQGDTEIKVASSVVIEDGATVTADEVKLVDGDDARFITNIVVSGEVDDAAFKEIRGKFESLESINMTDMTNTAIPQGAFTGMEKLKSVVIPEEVIIVGENAFAGCENLESITLPGVTAIGDNAFAGCVSLTSITVLGQAAETEAARMSAKGMTRGDSGISASSFSGINPNCLIYLSEGHEEAVGKLPNVIINKEGARVANGDIVLSESHPFNAPASFSLSGNSISMTVDIPGAVGDIADRWKGLVIPFTPDSCIYGKDFTPRRGEVLSMLSFENEEAETMSPQTMIVANRPFMANVCAPFDSVPVTFVARGKSSSEEFVYDVEFTPTPHELKACGKGMTLYGSYDGTLAEEEIRVLDANGALFVGRGSAEASEVGPFSTYLAADDASADSLAVGEHPLWVFDPVPSKASGSKLYRSSTVALESKTSGAEIRYTLDGSNPLTDGMAYSEPFSISGENVEVKAVAIYKGYESETVGMEFGLMKTNLDYNLEEGWNWISHNVETGIPVSNIMDDSVLRMLSQTQEVIRDPVHGIVGTLSTLNPLEAYKVYVSGDGCHQAAGGIAFDPSVAVKLAKGWNWIGCPAEGDALPLVDAFANLAPDEGDMIVGREGFATADGEGRWIGDLSQLLLGRGYMYLSGSPKEFVYNIAPAAEESHKSVARFSKYSAWTPASRKYPSVMPVISRIVRSGEEIPGGEYEVAAFCDDECRGVGVPVDGYMMISVFGLPGDKISFRIHPADGGGDYVLQQTATFGEEPVGSLKAPLTLDLSYSSSIDSLRDGAYEVYVENGRLVVKVEDDSIRLIEVYGIDGVRVASSTSSIETERLPAGVYIVVVNTANTRKSHKVEVR